MRTIGSVYEERSPRNNFTYILVEHRRKVAIATIPLSPPNCYNIHMKTILVDAINAFVHESGEIDQSMLKILNRYKNPKIILTGANDEQFKKFGLDKMPWPVFTLKHDPEKTDPAYFTKMLQHYDLVAKDVVYFEHKQDAVKSAQSVGIKTMFYDYDKKDYAELEKFLQENLD